MKVYVLDHLVLTVTDINATTSFYRRALGMKVIRFENDRVALAFGDQKINLHKVGEEVKPNARHATPGSADLCFITDDSLAAFVELLNDLNVDIELGPVHRTGAMSDLKSVYIRDPDGNLIEISNVA
jgi:catechol 2,3-dioxygenase-like lactoylglutathione lyase family enzyme